MTPQASRSPDWARQIQTAFDELDWQQLKIFARHTPTRRLEMMFDLCEFARQMIIVTERQRDPQIDEAELMRRVRARIQLGQDRQ